MGKKKAAPQRSQQACSQEGRSEYLGLYGLAATARDDVLRQYNTTASHSVAQANRQTALEREELEAASKEGQVNSKNKNPAVSFADDSSMVQKSQEKTVTFARDLITEIPARPIPEIEIVAEYPPEPLPLTKNGKLIVDEVDTQHTGDLPKEGITLLRYHFDPDRPSLASSDKAEFHLQSFYVDPSIRFEITTTLKNNCRDIHQPPFQILTREGAIDLLEFCQRQNPDFATAATEKIASAVEEGLIYLAININPEEGYKEGTGAGKNMGYVIALSLTKLAFDLLNSSSLPVGSARRSKVYQKAVTLQGALGELFPSNANLLVVPNGGKHAELITAKQVYSLVDNVQFRALLNKKKAPNESLMNIPGLLPRLRPYQEAAVQWMIRREREDTTNENTDEWELAWVAFCLKKGMKGSFTFLPEFKRQDQGVFSRGPIESVFYVCPFTGWLARSYREARSMTIDNVKDDSHQRTATGGILADSMGLGKSVQVLACILGNPDPEFPPFRNQPVCNKVSSWSSLASTEITNIRAVANGETPQTIESANKRARRTSNDVMGLEDGSAPGRLGSNDTRDGITVSSIGTAEMSDDDSSLCPGTPKSIVLKEHWVDHAEFELGSCICGQPISLFPCPAKDWIVVCENCDEPMHIDCAASEEEKWRLTSNSKSILYQKRFSTEKCYCLVCPESMCPCCVAENSARHGGSKIRSGATVIVTPPAISYQWEREVLRHTKNSSSDDAEDALKIVVYPGIKELCRQQQVRKKNGDFHLLHPRSLAKADIVLMTFDALLHDLGHSDANPFVAGSAGKASLRKRKRYRVVPSPLSSISWWRVVLDEAQRVETPTAGSAQMALKLEAKHRWAVSGTPIGKGKLDDLYGLLLFLRLTPPFSGKHWFRQCFSPTGNEELVSKRIQHLLKNAFWRSTASFDVVASQMGVPEQIEKKNFLKFSSIEKHFYVRQLEETLSLAGDVAAMEKKTKNKGGKNNLDMLARQLHTLRAACCHPQVGSSGIAASGKKRARNYASETGMSFSSRVLTMEEILDRLIDDAKNKCEEALRVVLFHTNPMAAISRLKVDAKNFHNVQTVTESDDFLLSQSCKLYLDALEIAEENAEPCAANGEVVLSGSPGFRSSQQHLRGGKLTLDWQLPSDSAEVTDGDAESTLSIWASFDYEGQSKKMKQIRVRAVQEVPESLRAERSEDCAWHLRYPRDCVLQVSNVAVGGEFVDILSFTLPNPCGGRFDFEESGWVVHGGFSIYKSKSWRIVVKNLHPLDGDAKTASTRTGGQYTGLEVELYEPTIASDSLPRLHTLHNAGIAFRELIELRRKKKENPEHTSSPTQDLSLPLLMSPEEIEAKAASSEKEAAEIERYHLEYAMGVRSECLRRLKVTVSSRQSLQDDFLRLSNHVSKKDVGFWDVAWWGDLVAHINLNGTPSDKASLCEKVQEVIDSFNQERGEWHNDKRKEPKPFPTFHDIQGLQVGLKLRFDDVRSQLGRGQYEKSIRDVMNLSPNPSDHEVFENRNCRVCKADWYMTGPKCVHCKLGEKLQSLTLDGLSYTILDAILKWSRVKRAGVRSSSTLKTIINRANKFFETFEAAKKEVFAASRLWRVHLDLLNVIDELNSCKSSMRLLLEGEDVSSLTEEQRGSVVVPIDVNARYHEHAAKQAMAIANLKRNKHTLQYLKNQSSEESQDGGAEDEPANDSAHTCMVCLSAFNNDRAVLACGHSFHFAPCLERLKKRAGNGHVISCPLRCTATTKCDEVLIASSKRRDDGSQSRRKVEGSWGTKVTAIVADLLSVSDLNEKSILFSMWEDMLDICEEAMKANGIKYVRATSLSQIGEATKIFRGLDCSVLLLNVKNGAEGLTLIEANHVFMIEPLLNYGLDSQARARCHRIGQIRRTYLHRYLIQDTIEVKIDQIRMQHQEDQLEDALVDSRKCTINAGGIDGGFSSREELMDILKI